MQAERDNSVPRVITFFAMSGIVLHSKRKERVLNGAQVSVRSWRAQNASGASAHLSNRHKRE